MGDAGQRHMTEHHDGCGTTPTQTMKAIVHDRYGTDPAQVLRVETVSRPTPTDDEVLVRMHSASVDRGTWHIMAGLPYPIRLAGFGVRTPKHLNPGRSLAGTVEAVGPDVSAFARRRRGLRYVRWFVRRVRAAPARTSSPTSPRTCRSRRRRLSPSPA